MVRHRNREGPPLRSGRRRQVELPRRIRVRPRGPDGEPAAAHPLLDGRPPVPAPVTRREIREVAAAAGVRVGFEAPADARAGPPVASGGTVVGLVLLVTCVLTLTPVLGDRALPPQPSWLGVLLGLVTACSAPVVVHQLIRRYRSQHTLLSGLILWTVGLAVISLLHALGRTDLPGPGHLLLLAGLPLVVHGLGAPPAPRPRRPFGSSLLVLDTVMMACAWLSLLWVLRLQDLGWSGGPGWTVAVLVTELLMLMLLLLVLADTGAGLAGTAVLVTLLLVTTDALAVIHLHGRPELADTPTSVSSTLLLLTWLVMVPGLLLVRDRPWQRVTRHPQVHWRSVVTLSNVLIPLGFTFGALAAHGTVDTMTLLLIGTVVLVIGIREIVRAGQAQELVDLLASQALRDPLTGLGNRRALADRLAPLIRHAHPMCVLTLDVDRFKMVNTQFGHSTGDDVLTAVGGALRDTCARVGAQAFRLGGDEFAIVVAGDLKVGVDLADRVRATVQTRVQEMAGVGNIALTASVGVAQMHPDGRPDEDPLQVLGRSADALRVAKQERNRVRAYSQDLAVESSRRARMEARLRLAVENGAITFHYQPVVDLRSGRVHALESLARWRDPELGQVSPLDFVPVAEQTGLIHPLGHAALDNALRVAARLAGDGDRLQVSVNVSPLQLRRGPFVPELFALADRHRASLRLLRLEVTEGIFMDADDPAVATLRKLAGYGVGIAIDDFGSGYSSLGYMSRLPIDMVKVDRSLTLQVGDARTRSVVKALLWVAESHGLQVVLEGVEDEQTAATLRRLGVRRGQGWLWSGAVPEQDLPVTLRVLGTVPERAQQVRRTHPRGEAGGAAQLP